MVKNMGPQENEQRTVINTKSDIKFSIISGNLPEREILIKDTAN
jgi:hypothetical protein